MENRLTTAVWVLVLLIPISVGVSTSSVRGTLHHSYVMQQSHGGISINGNDDLANKALVEGWPGNGSATNPFVIEGLSMSGVNNLTVTNVSCFFVVRNCEFTPTRGVFSCVYLDRVSNGRIESSLMKDAWFGLYVTGCQMIAVSRCTVMQCLDTGLFSSESNNCSVFGNQIHDANEGIGLANCSHVNVSSNRIYANDYGAHILATSMSAFTSNSFYMHTAYGVELDAETTGCEFSNNSFGGNVVDAEDYSGGNMWDNGVDEGNAWEGYPGYGTYYVGGAGGGVDHYPRTLDGSDCPVVNSPLDIVCTYPAASVSWMAFDPHPHNYSVFRNAGSSVGGSWYETLEHFYVDLSSFAVGSYNLTITVFNTLGKSASDSVAVQILSTTTSPVTSTTTYTTTHTDGTGNTSNLDPLQVLWFVGSVAVITTAVVLSIKSKGVRR
jgi:parallel beta-helix repeat protein